jgi:2,4-dienoyl-CoA reductase-like NADH-dependent reductase (Old Yellow Enzyme family)
MLRVVEAIAAAIGAERVALRLSPYTDMRGIRDDSIQRAIDKNVWLLKVSCVSSSSSSSSS